MKTRPYISHVIQIRFHDTSREEATIEWQMRRAFDLLSILGLQEPLLHPAHWFVAAEDKESSYLYPAFDEKGPTTAALAVIRQENNGKTALQSFVLWNGDEDQTRGASISSLFNRKDERSSDLTLKMRSEPDGFRLGTAQVAVNVVEGAIRIYEPLYCGLSPEQYDSVFPDRPGVGWMLYLPRVLTTQQVPEARALVPVMAKDDKGREQQTGTIIVSVTDEPFSDENPEHVKIANAIEIRLVDQDLLPRFSDL